VKLQLRLILISSIERVELFISILCPDNESSEMTTRSKKKDVQAVDIEDFNTREIAEGSEECTLLFVDNQRSFSLDISPVSCFSFSCSNLLGVLDFFDIAISFQGLEKFHSLGSFLKGSDGVSADYKGDFRDFLNSVTSSENERGRRRGSESRDKGIASLIQVNLSVPSSIHFSGGKHSTASTHVTESGLSGSVSSSTRNSRNTGDSATGTPRFG